MLQKLRDIAYLVRHTDNEVVATDTLFAAEPAHDDRIVGRDGATMWQIYYGKDSRIAHAFPMHSSRHEMPGTLDTRRHRLLEEFREIALWFGPIPQRGCCKRLLYSHMLYVPSEWREQVKELVVALKALTAAHASLMWLEMDELLYRPMVRRVLRHRPAILAEFPWADEKCKEERSVKTESTESTDSDSYSSY